MTSTHPPGALTPLGQPASPAARSVERRSTSKRIDTLLPEPTAADQYAFGLTFKRLFPKLRAITRRLMGAAEDVEDVLSQVGMNVWKKRHSIARCGGDPKCEEKYFVRAVINCVNNEFRTYSRNDDRTEPLEDDLATSEEGPGQPVQNVIYDELEWHVRRLTQMLPRRRRQAFSLHLSGMSYAEIAEVMGISVNTVSVHITESRAFFHPELSKLGYRTLPASKGGKKEHQQ